MANKELYMEDINNMTSDAVEDLLSSLEEFKLDADQDEVTKVVEDEIFEAIADALSKLTINDYRNHM